MLRIRFQDQDFLFAGDSLEQGGPITTDEAFGNGTASYAHLFKDGIVRRVGKKLGTVDQIQVIGKVDIEDVEPQDYGRAIHNVFCDPSWDG
jgi:hypothetical protein